MIDMREGSKVSLFKPSVLERKLPATWLRIRVCLRILAPYVGSELARAQTSARERAAYSLASMASSISKTDPSEATDVARIFTSPLLRRA